MGGRGVTIGNTVTGAGESNGGGAAEIGIVMGDARLARTPRSDTSSSNTKRLDRRELVGSRVGFSWGSSSPNNSTSVRTTTRANFSTAIYPSASISTGTVSIINGGQVDSHRSPPRYSGMVVMGSGAGATMRGRGIGDCIVTCSLAEP